MFAPQEFVEVTLRRDQIPRSGTIQLVNTTHMIVACEPEDASSVRPGELVQLVQLVNDSLYQIDTTVLRCQENCFVVPIYPHRLIDRRKSQRVPCKLPATLRKYPHTDDDSTASKWQAQVADLSLGGALVVVVNRLPDKAEFTLEIEMADQGNLTVQAELIRCTPMKASLAKKRAPFTHEAAMRFTQISRIDQVKVHRFVGRQSPAA